ncbi:hypothetical protein M3Y97_00408900 [Aphelenchoides bicaudatus]|nr:hypothetical protein M3Y97_00408900 [Aphelenchoides bicaudatus]
MVAGDSSNAVRGVDASSAMRVSFLEQAAMLLARKSSEKGDVLKVLSMSVANELCEISYVEQIRPSTQIKRSICKKCKVYLVPYRDGKPAIEVKRKKNRLIRKCLNCDQELSYQWNPKYKSRNEKEKSKTK